MASQVAVECSLCHDLQLPSYSKYQLVLGETNNQLFPEVKRPVILTGILSFKRYSILTLLNNSTSLTEIHGYMRQSASPAYFRLT